jgi:uncharacterized protein YkwD
MLEFLSQASQSHYGFNLLDLIIVAVVVFYAREGFVIGFTLAALDLLSFILSFVGALKFYTFAAATLTAYFSLPIGFANAIGFFLTAFIAEIILNILFRKVLRMAPALPVGNPFVKALKKGDRIFGMVPGIISAFIILTFLLTVIVSLPSSPLIKQLVEGSSIGSRMVANTSLFEKRLNTVFGGALDETLNFMTVKPQSDETVKLHFTTTKGIVDMTAEQEMFKLVNTERAKAGLHLLAFDDQLREVGRGHSQDMFLRGYFSHYTPEGLSPFDRMNQAGITYIYAGENLALAPSTSLAMQGRMNSPGHRANILNPNFGKIGIGVIDGGIYGKMYSQEFTN